MIYRVKSSSTVLDFGSMQAANQFLDNYPPVVKDSCSIGEISSVELNAAIAELTSQLSRIAVQGTTHYDWLISRLEYYQAALPEVEQQEAAIKAKVAALPTREQSSGRNVNEVWRPDR